MLFGFMREMSRRAGADIEAAQRGLGLASVEVGAPGARVDWDEIAVFFDRAHGHLPIDEMEKIGETYADTQLWQQIVARAVGSARLLYVLSFRVLTPPSFPHMDIGVTSHPAGVRIAVRMPQRYRGCPFFFHGTAGELRVLPVLLGKPPARLRADAGTHHGVYEIELDEPLGSEEPDPVAQEAVELMHRMVAAGLDAEESAAPSVLALQRRHALTLSEARVATRLADGRSVNEIARVLGIRVSTVRSHLKAAYAKTRTRGQAELVRLVLTGEGRSDRAADVE